MRNANIAELYMKMVRIGGKACLITELSTNALVVLSFLLKGKVYWKQRIIYIKNGTKFALLVYKTLLV